MSTVQPARDKTASGQCACGEVRFDLRGAPLLRFFCHCTICQAFNQSAVADYTVFRRHDVDLPPQLALAFQAYRPPPAIQRGKCSACGKAAIEIMRLPMLPKLVFVPTLNLVDPALAPPPSLHTFYNRRLADARDELPKYSGYWRSQLAFLRRLAPALLRAGN